LKDLKKKKKTYLSLPPLLTAKQTNDAFYTAGEINTSSRTCNYNRGTRLCLTDTIDKILIFFKPISFLHL